MERSLQMCYFGFGLEKIEDVLKRYPLILPGFDWDYNSAYDLWPIVSNVAMWRHWVGRSSNQGFGDQYIYIYILYIYISLYVHTYIYIGLATPVRISRFTR